MWIVVEPTPLDFSPAASPSYRGTRAVPAPALRPPLGLGPAHAGRAPRRRLAGCLLATALPLWAALWHRGLGLVAAQYAVTASVVWIALVTVRLALDVVDARVVGRAPASSRTLLIGPAAECRALAARRAFAPRGEHAVLGYVDSAAPAHPTALGSLIDLPALMQQYRVESVVVCGHMADSDLGEVVEQAITAGGHGFSLPRAFEVRGIQPSLG